VVTLKRFFTSMPSVNIEITWLWKLFFTLGTLKGFSPVPYDFVCESSDYQTVNDFSEMTWDIGHIEKVFLQYDFFCEYSVDQIVSLWEWFFTVVTLKRFFSSITSSVTIQLTRVWKWIFTLATFKTSFP
jgi:hypothetical protein